jgi:hypothetical protein
MQEGPELLRAQVTLGSHFPSLRCQSSPTKTLMSLVGRTTDRLTAALERLSEADFAIDLRIAYEMAFSIGDTDERTTELRYRLAQRAALFLGSSSSERQAIDGKAKRLYDLCSTVIHTGRISSK